MDDVVDVVDAKDLQINLQGFLHSHAATFVSDLWDLLMDAEQRVDGVPLQIRQEQEIERVLRESKPVIKEERVIRMKRERSPNR